MGTLSLFGLMSVENVLWYDTKGQLLSFCLSCENAHSCSLSDAYSGTPQQKLGRVQDGSSFLHHSQNYKTEQFFLATKI